MAVCLTGCSCLTPPPPLLPPPPQDKLGVSDDEFAKWQFAFVCIRLQPEYLTDDDCVGPRFLRTANSANTEVRMCVCVCGGGGHTYA